MPEKSSAHSRRLRVLRPAWIFPVSRPPIRDGLVVLEDGPYLSAGRGTSSIVYAGGPLGFTIPEGATVEDYPGAIAVPAFVNAHCHLELSSLAGAVEPSDDFTGWLKDVIQQRAVMAEELEPIRADIRRACAHLLTNGCATIGDFVSAFTPRTKMGVPLVEKVCHEVGLRGVFYSELIGFAPDRCDEVLEHLDRELARTALPGVVRAVAPHAPYSAAPRVIQHAAQRARRREIPFAIHVSEWPDERVFLLSGDGPCADLLRWRDNWDPHWKPPGKSPVVYLHELGATGPGSTFVHSNNLDNDEVALLADTATSVVHCPGTHAYFGRPPFNFQALLEAGVNLALGTDSLASNQTLDMRAEIRLAWEAEPNLDPHDLLRMATLNGARALGLEGVTGSLDAGKAADVLLLGADADWNDPDDVLRSALTAARPPERLLAGGRKIKVESESKPKSKPEAKPEAKPKSEPESIV